MTTVMQTRQVGSDTLLEACIENYSKGPMVLEYVRFDAAPPLNAVSIDIRDVMIIDFTRDDPLGSYIDQLQVHSLTLCSLSNDVADHGKSTFLCWLMYDLV